MKIAIMQPYIFPYIGYFQLITAIDKFVFFDDVNFIKRGWINRNQILVNNQAHLFTIPLQKASQNILIKDTKISYNENWVEKLVNTIENNYTKAPNFESAFPLIKGVLEKNFNSISCLAIHGVQEICDYLDIKKEFELSSRLYSDTISLKKEHRLIEICKRAKSNEYINPIGGKEIYEWKDFKLKDIKLSFIQNNIQCYKQFNSEFIGGLSIIDVLMFNSKEEIKITLDKYKLI